MSRGLSGAVLRGWCSFDAVARAVYLWSVVGKSENGFCEAHEVSFFMLHDPSHVDMPLSRREVQKLLSPTVSVAC